MAKDILSMYGGDARTGRQGGNRATCGGITVAKELPYSPPQGPKGIMDKGAGLGGTNHGNCGTQGRR